jgi:hypothetical protein
VDRLWSGTRLCVQTVDGCQRRGIRRMRVTNVTEACPRTGTTQTVFVSRGSRADREKPLIERDILANGLSCPVLPTQGEVHGGGSGGQRPTGTRKAFQRDLSTLREIVLSAKTAPAGRPPTQPQPDPRRASRHRRAPPDHPQRRTPHRRTGLHRGSRHCWWSG